MARCLVLLENTLDDQGVIDELVSMCTDGSTLHLVVPMRPISDQDREFVDVEADDTSEEEHPVTTLANWRLRKALLALQDAGLDQVDGEIAPADTLGAAQKVVSGDGYDRLVIVTNRTGMTGRLKLDTAGRIGRKADLPVVHLQENAKREDVTRVGLFGY